MNTTPRSYSRSTLTALNSSAAAMTARTATKMSICISLLLAFDSQDEPLDTRDAQLVALAHRARRLREPVLAERAHVAALGEILECDGGRADHGFAPRGDLEPARAHRRVDADQEHAGGGRGGGRDDRHRDAIAGQVGVEQD